MPLDVRVRKPSSCNDPQSGEIRSHLGGFCNPRTVPTGPQPTVVVEVRTGPWMSQAALEEHGDTDHGEVGGVPGEAALRRCRHRCRRQALATPSVPDGSDDE